MNVSALHWVRVSDLNSISGQNSTPVDVSFQVQKIDIAAFKLQRPLSGGVAGSFCSKRTKSAAVAGSAKLSSAQYQGLKNGRYESTLHCSFLNFLVASKENAAPSS